MNLSAQNTIVMKFGGASLASPERIARAAALVATRSREGRLPVVVVSAMAGETDRILDLGRKLEALGLSAESPSSAELDVALAAGEQVSAGLMAHALTLAGLGARSFLAHQLPILTDGAPGDARILRIETASIEEAFAQGLIPVVAGFQGIDAQGRIATLGRGGSDTTAVALAAALGAGACEFYKDVDGVYPVDPKQDPEAARLSFVTYERMQALAGGGARILHAKAVALADRLSVPLHVRSAFNDGPGTWIGTSGNLKEKSV